MSGIQSETTTDAGGGENVGWIDAGDWMSYQVTIPATGTYRVVYRVASPNSNTTLRLENNAGATQLGSVTIPNTGGWQNWTNVAHNVTLPAGTYSIGIATTTGGFNINYLTITGNLSARPATITKAEPTAENNILTLSPNPVASQLFLRGNENVKTMRIYDISGHVIMTIKNPGNSISVQTLKPGIYIALIEGRDNNKKKIKFVKE